MKHLLQIDENSDPYEYQVELKQFKNSSEDSPIPCSMAESQKR